VCDNDSIQGYFHRRVKSKWQLFVTRSLPGPAIVQLCLQFVLVYVYMPEEEHDVTGVELISCKDVPNKLGGFPLGDCALHTTCKVLKAIWNIKQ
jgi:hypothetical protein